VIVIVQTRERHWYREFISRQYIRIHFVKKIPSTSSMFPGSAVLVQNSPGVCTIIFYTAFSTKMALILFLEQHTSLIVQSNCTSQHLATYFATGELPADGTVCQVDEPLFPGAN